MTLTERSTSRRFKDDVFEQFARIGKAFSSPKRLELLDVLCQGPRTVEVLADLTGMTVANTSQHLKALRESRLVEARKDGLFVVYQVADTHVVAFYLHLQNLAERRLAEVDAIRTAFLEERDALEVVDGEELLRRALEGDVIVLDVRPCDEFAAGHLPGARSVPLPELEAALAGIPRDREIVAYCRGPYCVWAVDAVERIRALGFTAHRLDQGPPQWEARGIALERGIAR